MSQSTIVRSMSQQDLMSELRFFIKGASKKDKCNLVDLTKSALTLLKCLPASKVAVFDYFSKVFDKAALNYIDAIEVKLIEFLEILIKILVLQTEIKTGKMPSIPESDELIVSDIHTVLVSFINENPVAWAPTISTWSLELLGETSSKYAGRAHFSSSKYEVLKSF